MTQVCRIAISRWTSPYGGTVSLHRLAFDLGLLYDESRRFGRRYRGQFGQGIDRKTENRIFHHTCWSVDTFGCAHVYSRYSLKFRRKKQSASSERWADLSY
jgi:hypothetical protein